MTEVKQTFISFLALTKASAKMYYRNKGAIVFSLLIPIGLLSIFGFLSRGSIASIKIGLTNYSEQAAAVKFVDALKDIHAFKVSELTEAAASAKLAKDEIDLQVVVPKSFGTFKDGKISSSEVQTRYNSGKPQNGQIANLAVVQIVSKMDRALTHSPAVLKVSSEGVSTNNLTYFDFILPGILSMTIMQLGIFGVAFSFVAMKSNGALRRIQATPVHPIYFLLAQAVVRLAVTLMVAAILVGFGTYFFNFHMIGSYFEFGLICLLGIFTFLGIGFTIAGWARDETQVAPVANLIQLPLLMLSGVFFPRDGFPLWLKSVTDYSPLTYLSHGLRSIANEGSGFSELPTDVIGLSLWMIAIYFLAAKVFKWE